MQKEKENLIFQDVGRYIKADIKREVRRRCGFGCVVCGNPIIQYDHMKQWSKVHEHKAVDITLLCPNHHMEATAGRMPRVKVLAYNENPYNKNALISQAHTLWYYGNKIDFMFGNTTFRGDLEAFPSFRAITIQNRDIILAKKSEDTLLIDIEILDSSGCMVLCIKENELVFSLDNWDIQFVGQILQINEASRMPRLIITFQPPDKVIIKKATFFYHGRLVEVSQSALSSSYGNSAIHMENCLVHNCGGGLYLT